MFELLAIQKYLQSFLADSNRETRFYRLAALVCVLLAPIIIILGPWSLLQLTETGFEKLGSTAFGIFTGSLSFPLARLGYVKDGRVRDSEYLLELTENCISKFPKNITDAELERLRNNFDKFRTTMREVNK